MKIVFLLLVMGLCQTAWAMTGDLVGDPDAGKNKAVTCSACHGTGVGIAPNYPNLAGQGAPYLIKQITDIKSKARVVLEMAGMVESLTAQDIADIAAWFASQTPVQGQAPKDSVAIAQSLFRGGDPAKGIAACSACHSPLGTGNVLARYPRLAGQSPEYLKKQLYDFADPLRETHRTNDGDTRIMRDTAEKLSNTQIEALGSYISGLRSR